MSHSSTAGHQPNRLINESSPYLLQHAYNPVNWYPWGEEAFELAKSQDKPIFLSVGYSACHWCHVMERESFENENIARFLNEHFISIKVDREERPDVDQIYMTAVQLITQRGGWPMSVFMTPEGEPFYGGTYWPPTSRMGMPGFGDLLVKLNDYWINKRNEVQESAQQLLEAIQSTAAPVFESADLNEETLRNGMQLLLSNADRRHGGFGRAPKFPHPMDLRLLLRCWKRFNHDQALQTVLHTLTMMARGGIYDQLGGGFHRYSTDAVWLVPHFEKMLYDNALLVPAYIEAYQIAKRPEDARVVHETLQYVLKEMTSPEGGFFSTQDADSEGVEGKFFVWSRQEVESLLGDETEIFCACYDVTGNGNWEGTNILNLPRSIEDSAAQLGMESSHVESVLQRCRQVLLEHRATRIAPGRDDKILVSWNGLMISAFAQAALVFDEPRYLEAATRAADFILAHMRDDQGQLKHSHMNGQARFTAYLDDYACLIDGLIDLFQAGSDEQYLQTAVELSEDVIRRFSDANGGYYYTADDHEKLITRTKDSQDNATPSGNGMMATALAKLAKLTGRTDLETAAVKTLSSLAGLLAEHPNASGQSLMALDFVLGSAHEVVLVDQTGSKQGGEIWKELFSRFIPNKVAFKWEKSDSPPELSAILQGKLTQKGPALFVCHQGACETPTSSLTDVKQQLELI